jgi:FkbM family methyltransferase
MPILNVLLKLFLKIKCANEKSLFLFLARILKPDLVFDIGSRDGADAKRFRLVLPKSKIIAFEANKELYLKMLSDSTLKKSNITCYNYAVEKKSGFRNFYIFNKSKGTGSLLQRKNKNSLKKKKVRTVSLDNFVENFKLSEKKIFLWIDIEGMAYNLIQGATKTLRNTDAILVELEKKELFKNQILDTDTINKLKKNFFLLEVSLNLNNTSGNYIFLNKRYLKSLKLIFLIFLYKIYTYYISMKLYIKHLIK